MKKTAHRMEVFANYISDKRLVSDKKLLSRIHKGLLQLNKKTKKKKKQLKYEQSI